MHLSLAIIWLALALVLGVAELAAPGVFLIFVAIAAAMTGVLAFALPDLPLVVQLLSVAAWSLVTILIGRRWYRDYPVATADRLLNDRAARLVGETVTITEPIRGGKGRARLGDGEWIATGPDMPSGAHARVVSATGATIAVEPIAPDA